MFFNESNRILGGGILDVQPTESGLTGDAAGVYRALAESAEDWYNLREKMMRLEHRAILGSLNESTAHEAEALLEAGGTDFFRKIANWFKNLLAKLKEIWRKFVAAINQFTMNDKDFVKKYKKIISNRNLQGFEVRTRNWKTGDLGKGLNFGKLEAAAVSYMSEVQRAKTENAVKSMREAINSESFEDQIRGWLLGKNSVEASEFAEQVNATFFKNGEAEPETLGMNELPSVGDLLKHVEDAQANIKSAEDSKRTIEKMLSEAAKFYDGLADKLFSADDSAGKIEFEGKSVKGVSTPNSEHYLGSYKKDGGNQLTWAPSKTGSGGERIYMREAANLSATACRKISSIASSAYGMLISAIRSRRADYRAILARMATYTPKSESYNFGADYDSILDQF